jgi:hypothetical protein
MRIMRPVCGNVNNVTRLVKANKRADMWICGKMIKPYKDDKTG